MIHALRLVLVLPVLVVAGLVAGVALPILALRNHAMRTAVLLLPAYHPAFRLLAHVVSHYCDGYCWKCGSRAPTAADLRHPS